MAFNTIYVYSLSEGHVLGQGDGGVVVLLVVVHPHLGRPPRVLCEHVSGSAGEGVGVLLAEDVADAGAGDDLEGAAALPHAERDLCGEREKNISGIEFGRHS